MHEVSISEFWMADAPVTREQYGAIMGEDPSHFDGAPDLPADSVSRVKACEFCSKLSEINGVTISLPSEAEWEYACRAGSTTEYHFGDSAAELCDYAWFEMNSGGRTATIRGRKPNGWGLYDMIGNVWEWCLDSWHEDYTGAPVNGSPRMNVTGRARPYCVRAGAWDMDAFRCRSSYRSYDWEETGTSRNGFRVVMR